MKNSTVILQKVPAVCIAAQPPSPVAIVALAKQSLHLYRRSWLRLPKMTLSPRIYVYATRTQPLKPEGAYQVWRRANQLQAEAERLFTLKSQPISNH